MKNIAYEIDNFSGRSTVKDICIVLLKGGLGSKVRVDKISSLIFATLRYVYGNIAVVERHIRLRTTPS